MNRIDGGWQFRVYEDGDKIIKVPKSRFETLTSILNFRPLLILRPLKLLNKLNWILDERNKSLKLLEQEFFPQELIAKTELREGNLVQERVEMVRDRLQNSDLDSRKKIVDDYIEFTIECWKYGFCEKSFNFTSNHGYVGNKLVLVDIGEITTDRNEVENYIDDEFWLNQSVYQSKLDEKLKPYFKSQMNRELSKRKLEKVWNTNRS